MRQENEIACISSINKSVSKYEDQRIIWADVCRVCSIYGVILIHSCGAFFYSYGNISLSSWLAANALDSIARVAVPLFVMLSGAMLLKPSNASKSISEVFRRVIKVLIPLLFWSAAYLYRNNDIANYGESLKSIFYKPAMYHLWFVYMIIGLYILLPFLQAIYNNILLYPGRKVYFFLIWFLITSFPSYFPLPLLGLMQLSSFFGYGGFFILGGIIAQLNLSYMSRISSLLMYVIFSAVTFFLTWYFSELSGAPVEKAYVYFTPNVVLAALAIFTLIANSKFDNFNCFFIKWLSDRSFIVFFVHVLVLEYVRFSDFIRFFSERLHVFWLILLISIITLLGSYIIAAGIRCIPHSERIAG